jgi:DNA-directed RNA polymerase subunit M/transcription elongation factor TFIIS
MISKEREGDFMKCPKCGSENVNIQIVQKSEKTSKSGNGLAGNLNNAARGVTALCTLGMSNLVWKKSKGGEKTKIINEKVCVCQSCGNTWNI